MAKNIAYNNPKSSKIREFIRIHFLSYPLAQTRKYGEKVLDLGCGWGFYFKINPKAYGIDSDTRCIKELKDKGYKAVVGDITSKLPFPNNSFNWVVAHDVFEHFSVDQSKLIFNETHRILADNGHLLILVPDLKGYNSGIKRKVGHKHFVTKKDILSFSENRFNLQKHFSYPFPEIIGKYFTHNKRVFLLKKI